MDVLSQIIFIFVDKAATILIIFYRKGLYDVLKNTPRQTHSIYFIRILHFILHAYESKFSFAYYNTVKTYRSLVVI